MISLFALTHCSTTKNFKWTKDTISKANSLGLTKTEIIILASLVEKETNFLDEKPKIARVYLNRLQKGMLLQSDPTVLYALGDTMIKRLTKKHLEIDSTYNTYKYQGLPPGPISEPSKETILAVLNADTNNYLYFCAKPDFSGHFNYAETYIEHLENTKLYIEALNKMKSKLIKK